jgi:type II secretory pathway pseudopilin PulG
MKFKSFTKSEFLALGVIFALLLVVSVPNFLLSIQRSRDLTRKDDLMAIGVAANKFQEKYFYYPNSIEDLSEFLTVIPNDPQTNKGVSYVFLSNRRRYQIFASLEDKEQDEYDESIEARGIDCGVRLCNFGKAEGATPLDKTLEEYENELEKNLNEE